MHLLRDKLMPNSLAICQGLLCQAGKSITKKALPRIKMFVMRVEF
jgi:hypothetical protein